MVVSMWVTYIGYLLFKATGLGQFPGPKQLIWQVCFRIVHVHVLADVLTGHFGLKVAAHFVERPTRRQ